MSIIERRLVKELAMVLKDKSNGTLMGISINMKNNNARYYELILEGPQGTPYEFGIFKIEIYYTDTYPQDPPIVRFLNKIYHPNIDGIGRICLDILKDKWTPLINMTTLSLSLIVLLCNPNVDDPLDAQVSKHFKDDPESAKKTAVEWTKLYAK